MLLRRIVTRRDYNPLFMNCDLCICKSQIASQICVVKMLARLMLVFCLQKLQIATFGECMARAWVHSHLFRKTGGWRVGYWPRSSMFDSL